MYGDYCLCISQHLDKALERLGKYFKLNTRSAGPPKIYLGRNISQVQLPNDVNAWDVSVSKYIQKAVKNVEVHM